MKSISCVRLLVTPCTVGYQAPLSIGFSRQEYWSGVPLPSPILSPDKDNSFYILKEACWKRAVQAQTALCGPFREEMIEEARWDGMAGLGWGAGAAVPLALCELFLLKGSARLDPSRGEFPCPGWSISWECFRLRTAPQGQRQGTLMLG